MKEKKKWQPEILKNIYCKFKCVMIMDPFCTLLLYMTDLKYFFNFLVFLHRHPFHQDCTAHTFLSYDPVQLFYS